MLGYFLAVPSGLLIDGLVSSEEMAVVAGSALVLQSSLRDSSLMDWFSQHCVLGYALAVPSGLFIDGLASSEEMAVVAGSALVLQSSLRDSSPTVCFSQD